MIEFRLLGPVEVRAGGRPVDPGQPRQRAVLASLLIDAGRPVSIDTLVERVWGEFAPSNARHALHTYVTRIRGMLAGLAGDHPPVRLEHRSGAYVLHVPPDRVDLHRFQRLIDEARAPGIDDDERAVRLRAALKLWRGEPLGGVSGAWAGRVREAYRRRRVDAVVLWAGAELRRGDPGPVIVAVSELIIEHPLVEPLTGVLMRALTAAGRTVEALDCYTALRKRLVDELGAEPGAELQDIHREVLRAGAEGPPAPAGPLATPVGPARPAAPAQLPAGMAWFVGREAELAELDRLLIEGEPSVAVVSGTAGVGKSALAVHWAHRVAGRFPDGQLYVNLRGFDPGAPALDPQEAVLGFLQALGVPQRQVPAGLDQQAARLRSVLAGRQVLIVLDNARDELQVRPLLPGPGSIVVVTSRFALPGLVVAGARPVPLPLPGPADARALLAARLGAARVDSEPAAVDEIMARCALLPLALAVVAARAAARPEFALAVLAAELGEGPGGLAPFAAADPTIDVRAVFSWSYRRLSDRAARAFRLFGVHPGPEVSIPSAAALVGVPVPDARPVLAELTQANLLVEHVPGRFGCHDLLRAYAVELSTEIDSAADRLDAQRRVVDFYLGSAWRMARAAYPHRDQVPIPDAVVEAAEPGPVDAAGAAAWLAAERPVLLAVVEHAASAGFAAHAWRLAWTLLDFLDRGGHWHDVVATQTVALRAVDGTDDLSGRAHAHRGLGLAHARWGRYDQAYDHLARALALFDRLGDHTRSAHTHINLSWILECRDRFDEALEHAEQALVSYRVVGHAPGHARALNTVGWDYSHLGEHRRALELCGEALTLFERIGDRYGQADAWDALGHAHHRLGEHAEAVDCYQRSLEMTRALGDRYHEALLLMRLGDVHRDTGRDPAALDAWRAALAILDRLGHPDAARVRTRLGGAAAAAERR